MCPASAGQSLESRLAAQRSVVRSVAEAIMAEAAGARVDLGPRPAASTEWLPASSAAWARVPNWAGMVVAMGRYDLIAVGCGVESEAPWCGGTGMVLGASSKLQGRSGGVASRESVASSSTTGPDNKRMQQTKAARSAPFLLRRRGQSLRAAFAADLRC